MSATLPATCHRSPRSGLAHTHSAIPAAIHLLRAGNDLTVVRGWLGHASVLTTDQYTDVDIELKRRALEAAEVVAPSGRPPSWNKEPDLLSWLEAL